MFIKFTELNDVTTKKLSNVEFIADIVLNSSNHYKNY